MRDVTKTQRHHGNRHGRSEEARQAVLEAADDLLVERGFAGFTIEGVAARAGVAKQTIYRWWPSKVDILMEALVGDIRKYLAMADTGTLATDLRHYAETLAVMLTRTDQGAVFRALAGQAQHDPATAARFRAECVDPLRAKEKSLFERAAERGEVAADLDAEVAADRLFGPLYYRVLVTGDDVSTEYVDALVTDFLGSISR
ncbi:TetR family transcriptional regulator [Kibdelosporangium phytohabitans]|uniref:TetR family transcriptional regulator n=1 Tax=Kibdelosporangium phytohabitans TaxID=860235 RepID=A0A0N9I948_9PSEU|nr:TetR/AcrR family transcriptional regulator [Kibdelosporangium phytohabitans]ALG14913.1 TetR family transcriptional regulator [Kibdelosporangium phytohabitans]